MSKIGKIFKFGYGALDDLGFFSPTEKAIDALGQNKFPAKDLYRLEDGKPAGLLSKFGRPVQDEMMFTGLEDAILNVPDGGSITSQELKDYLAKNGFDEKMGARPMSRLIQDTIRKALADELLFGDLVNGGEVEIDIDSENKIILNIKSKQTSSPKKDLASS